MTQTIDSDSLPPIGPFFMAAVYAAAVVALGMFLAYGGGEYGLGQIAGGIAFFVALIPAALFAPLFWMAYRFLPGPLYFATHLVVGFGLGALRSARSPYASEWHHFVYTPDAAVISCASMAAWLYVVLRVPENKKLGPRARTIIDASPMILILAPFVLAIPIHTAPYPQDPSCHNTFRGGRSSAKPAVVMTLRIESSEKGRLAEIYDDFANQNALEIKGHRIHTDSPQRSICNDDVVISAGGVHEDGRHSIAVYPHIDGDWEPHASELICRLEAEWGDTRVFTGKGGEVIDRPAVLGECS